MLHDMPSPVTLYLHQGVPWSNGGQAFGTDYISTEQPGMTRASIGGWARWPISPRMYVFHLKLKFILHIID